MTKSYKCIKKYPNGPDVGFKLYPEKGVFNGYVYGGYIVTPNLFPEYWEEVVEKNYTILSFYKEENGVYYDLDVKKRFGDYSYILRIQNTELHGNLDEKTLLQLNYKINSIERLSDGEVFTVGDKVIGFDADKDGFIIKNIFLSGGNLCFATYSENSNPIKGRSSFLADDFPVKIKIPLFTTEDGVDIFKGDKFSEVTPNFSIAANTYHALYKKNSKFFSTKEEAEAYVLFNKPCLSLIEVANLVKANCRKQLINLVKQKMDL